jgi:hypothetical protein
MEKMVLLLSRLVLTGAAQAVDPLVILVQGW